MSREFIKLIAGSMAAAPAESRRLVCQIAVVLGEGRIAVPFFLAVENPMVAVATRSRRQSARCSRADSRLGQTECAYRVLGHLNRSSVSLRARGAASKFVFAR